MKVFRITKIVLLMMILVEVQLNSRVYAELTEKQANDVASFATTFIEKGNARRDEKGYPLLVYALSNNWNTCVDIRNRGYNGILYHVKNNNYHMKNGKYLDLGEKWCMDCGGFMSYVYNVTLGLDMDLGNEPWHIKDMYADAKKGENSKYFYFVYKDTPIQNIDFSKLMPGDGVLRIGSKENHGLIYIGEEMTAHASRNAIKYSSDPLILGFDVVKLNKFYLPSTKVSIIRVKDGIIPADLKANSTITWPDTGEVETLLKSEEVDEDVKSSEDNKNVEILDFRRPTVKTLLNLTKILL